MSKDRDQTAIDLGYAANDLMSSLKGTRRVCEQTLVRLEGRISEAEYNHLQQLCIVLEGCCTKAEEVVRCARLIRFGDETLPDDTN